MYFNVNLKLLTKLINNAFVDVNYIQFTYIHRVYFFSVCVS